jgi:hypothetical protein
MKGKLALVCIAAVFFIASGTAQAASEFTSIEGDWWIGIKGGDRGAGAWRFSNLFGGNFAVEGTVMTLESISPIAPFIIAPGASLQIDYKGKITGEMDIVDLEDTTVPPVPIGALTINSGTVDKKNSNLSLKGDLEIYPNPAVAIQIQGMRFPEIIDYTGRTIEGVVKGDHIKSSTFDFSVSESMLGFPFFYISGGGSAKLDGANVPLNLESGTGIFVRSPTTSKNKSTNIFGTVETPPIGGGPLTGNLRIVKNKPEFTATVQADRKFSLSGRLNLDAVIPPILSINPFSIEFGSVALGDAVTADFMVSNAGDGTLEGTATVLDGTNFWVLAGSPFSLGPGESTPITIQFAPFVAGDLEDDVVFSSNGGSSELPVSGTATEP